jgi:hypothetical protein
METNISKSTKFTVIALLIAEVITVIIPVIVLGRYFNFPDILRQPAETAFTLFRDNQSQIVAGYYVFLMSALLYIPLTIAIRKLFEQSTDKLLLQSFSSLGLATAVFQSIGFIRWIFTMPYLTNTYFLEPESKQSVTIIYEMLNRYAGMSIGEHLGFLAMGSWTILLGIILLKSNQASKWLSYLGILTGILLIVSACEHFGGQNASLFGTINFVANVIWTFLLLGLAFQIAISSGRNKDSR